MYLFRDFMWMFWYCFTTGVIAIGAICLMTILAGIATAFEKGERFVEIGYKIVSHPATIGFLCSVFIGAMVFLFIAVCIFACSIPG